MKISITKYSKFIFFIALMVIAGVISAQCPMCKIAVESNLKNGGSAGKGLNNGIFILLLAPYLTVGCIAYFWWKNKKVIKD